MTEQWKLKLRRAPSAVHGDIDSWITAGLANGALGGKLVGAGGGGFLLFLAHSKSALRKKMQELGLREVGFSLDYQGSVLQ
jgi:D-glycero-alpha-D-manno-heptose-7-phosphate kinase